MDALSNTSLVTVLSLSDSPSDTSAVLTREEDEIDPGVQKINGDAQSGRPPLLCWNSGVGLGPISIEFFAREKWPLRNQEDSIQYGKFANLIFKRIEAGESNNTETACFCEMFGTVEHWLYMIPLLEFLPESKENGLPLVNEQLIILVEHVHQILEAKEQERLARQANKYASKGERIPTAEEVLAETNQKVARILFGSKAVADPTPTMTRFLKSWVEMAYPGKVVQETMEKCEKTGKVMSRDSLGLPRGLGEARTPSLRGAKSPGSNVHDSRAQKKLAPVTVESPAHRKGPMTKGSSIPSSPPKFPSYPAPARFIRNHSRQPDDRGYSSVELEDSPSESLLGDLTDEEKPTFRKTQTDRGTVGGNGFRVFDKAPYDYGKFTRPITKETARSCQMKKVGWSPCQKTKTGDGMLVARGFDRPCPAKGHAMLKEIDDTAATYPLMGDAPIMLCKPEPAIIRRQRGKTFFAEMNRSTEDVSRSDKAFTI